MTFWPVCEYNAAAWEAPVPPVALVEGSLVSSTRTIGMVPVVGEISMETFVGDIDVAYERECFGDKGGYCGSR